MATFENPICFFDVALGGTYILRPSQNFANPL